MPAAPIITITTDFGLDDPYVAIMKGVILGIMPGTTLVDITHSVPAQDVRHAAQIVASVWRYFPTNTIHLAVVDPGVGTRRRALAIESPHGTFVGPDNGVFCASLESQDSLKSGGILSGARGVELRSRRYRREPVSRTFHGRDIFAPAAAHLAAGVALEELGPAIDRLDCPAIAAEIDIGADEVRGHVVRVDHFGNAITDIPASLVAEHPHTEVRGLLLDGLARSYQDAEIVALIGSHGHLEIAARNGSASAQYGLRIGDEVVVRGPK